MSITGLPMSGGIYSIAFQNSFNRIFLKFDHPIYENDTSPFGKGGSRGIFQVDSLLTMDLEVNRRNYERPETTILR
jgi:hypothetical protein